MSPPAFYSVALCGRGADLCVTCFEKLIVKIVGRQDSSGDLSNAFDFVFIEGHNCLDKW